MNRKHRSTAHPVGIDLEKKGQNIHTIKLVCFEKCKGVKWVCEVDMSLIMSVGNRFLVFRSLCLFANSPISAAREMFLNTIN